MAEVYANEEWTELRRRGKSFVRRFQKSLVD